MQDLNIYFSRLLLLMAQHHVMGARTPHIPKRQESTMDTDGIMTDEDIMSPGGSGGGDGDDIGGGPGRGAFEDEEDDEQTGNSKHKTMFGFNGAPGEEVTNSLLWENYSCL